LVVFFQISQKRKFFWVAGMGHHTCAISRLFPFNFSKVRMRRLLDNLPIEIDTARFRTRSSWSSFLILVCDRDGYCIGNLF